MICKCGHHVTWHKDIIEGYFNEFPRDRDYAFCEWCVGMCTEFVKDEPKDKLNETRDGHE